ncbi:MAG: DMT family transporter [Thermomicrobiales bacterium]|nr:DMT family transporter [Thermomicrobiales bacterium]
MLRVAPVIFLAFWSGGYSAGKIGVAYASPMTLLVVRYAIVLLLLAPLLLWKRPPLPATRAQWVHLAAVGVLIQGCYFALVYVALSSNISSAAVAMIVSLQPILVALAAPQLAGEEVSRQTWLGLGLGLLGAVLVILARSRVEAVSTIGVAAAVAALACITAGAMYEKRYGVGHHPVTANVVQYAAGLGVALPFALLREDLHVEWVTPLVLALAYLIVCNSLIAMTLLLLMIRHGEVSRVSALFFLVPPLAAVIGWLVLDEAMPPLAWIGLVLAAAGVALAAAPGGVPRLRR